MKKSHKIIWGVLTVAPILMAMVGFICFIVFIVCMIPGKGGTAPDSLPGQAIGAIFGFYGLFLIGIFLGFLVHISYYIHLVRKDDMTKDMKTLWVVLFLVLNILANIVYWFMVVLPEPESDTQPGLFQAVPVKRRRKK